jgi:broad specificity phosphatase PhoE
MYKLAILLFVGLSAFLVSCKKETQAKVQTVTVRDTVYVEVHDTTTIPAMISDTTITFIVLRHAEKESTGTDPNLSSDGVLRAAELKRILANVPVKAIYSTPFNRTRQTVQPLAADKSITVEEYATTEPYAQLVSDITSANRGKVVVVVGHSNTVPDILKELSKNTFNVSISESQYDNLFVVTLHDKLSPKVTALKYGKDTP